MCGLVFVTEILSVIWCQFKELNTQFDFSPRIYSSFRTAGVLILTHFE